MPVILEMKQKLKEIIYRRYNISFSKSGEDLQLKKLINNSTPGVYIDIGCWHPIKASNSYYFSLRKWKGICIDPNPEIGTFFKKIRPNDIFINKGVSSIENEKLKYYMFHDNCTSMNTFDLNFIKENNLDNNITHEIEISTIRLDNLLDSYIKEGDRLDFFDVDVEGMDLEVLKSNNWKKYRPKIILVESSIAIQEDLDSEITKYLESQNYSICGKNLIHKKLGNLIFIDNFQ